MPELPEVETVKRALQARLAGRRFAAVAQRRPDLRFPLPERLPERLVGRAVVGFRRRAKYILADLDDGETLLLHLGMSGRLVLGGPPAPPHEHLTFAFDDGAVLRFVDPRRFGMLGLAPTAALPAHPWLARLGMEPLEAGFTGRSLRAALAGRRTAVKLALMDQRVVVGVGNIYANEALFRARLSPFRPAGGLGPAEARRLAAGVRAVLRDAIEAGGSSLRDYVRADGGLGFFQDRFLVYDRAGLPCPACGARGGRGARGAGAVVRRAVQANRATYYCPACQR